ncbi:calcium-binding protein [Massilia sp. CCM 8734]|uniref:calcium-binding protein n=1 Tax=Massilia sp. CCM 8734 TaxID=2609283 RepID=UPI00142133EE|nr:calcium-binding protein [Massilia sp. CCM 8734]NHZ95800.1 type I secretion C-terminal target domain-containing protein [Massilia sp. CCM 8734]
MSTFNAVTEHHADLNSNAALQPGPITAPAGVGRDLQGSNADDTLFGAEFNDTISGNGGEDVMFGYGGDDYIVSNDPDDGARAKGDVLFGNDGNDTLLGGRGQDVLNGNVGDDFADGGAGNDQLNGEQGNDTLQGGAGHDTLSDHQGRDSLLGGGGVDFLDSERGGSSVLDGGIDNDMLLGDGQDTLIGGGGNDRITIRTRANEAVATTLADGGDGNDLFSVALLNQGSARVTGGGGRDVYLLERESGPAGYVVTDFAAGPGGDRIDVSRLLAGVNLSLGDPFSSARGYLKLVQDGADTVLQFDADGARGTASVFTTVLRLEGVAAQSVAANISTSQISPAGIDDGEIFIGDERDDTIFGSSLNDRYEGNGGADIMLSGEGHDTLLGGAGADGLFGMQGDDLLDGGEGDDNLKGGEGSNTLLGGAGNDWLTVDYAGDSLLDGGDGNDNLKAGGSQLTGFGTVRLSGGAGDDYIQISSAASAVTVTSSGGSGHDTFVLSLSGTPGNIPKTTLTDFSVGADSDSLDLYLPGIESSYPGNPFGADGYLRLEQRGADTVLRYDEDGAAGKTYTMIDVLTLRNVAATSLARAHFIDGYDPAGSLFGRLLTGTAGADSIEGDTRAEHLIGMGGSDTLLGGAGSDLLDGGIGDDLLDGGDGADTLVGGDGADILTAGDGDDSLDGDAGNDDLSGGVGNDVLHGGAGTDTINGGSGDDALFADAGDDVLDGAAGNDTLDGGSGSVQLNGGNGNDVLKVAGNGNSGLFGGRGADLIEITATEQPLAGRVVASGGEDADTIVFTRGALDNTALTASGGAGIDTYLLRGEGRLGSLTVKDFAPGAGGDRIDLTGSAAPAGVLEFVQSGSATLVRFDADGAAGPLFAATLMSLQNVLASSMTNDNVVGAAGAPVQLVGVADAASAVFIIG